MAAPVVSTHPPVRLGAPETLFEFDAGLAGRVATFDVAADGRFLMARALEQQSTFSGVHVVVNWLEDVRAELANTR